MKAIIEKQVKSVIASCISVDEYMLDQRTHLIEQLYVDSLDLLDIVIMLSDEFCIDINEEDFAEIETIGGICNLVEQRITICN